MARARRRKLDVRYDEGDVVAAEAVAVATGVVLADVMRAAVHAGLGTRGFADALRAESTAGGGGAGGARVDVDRLSARGIRGATLATSGGAGNISGAGAGAAAAPRPVAAPSAPQMKLEVVIARRIAAHHRRGQVAPADLSTARRGIKQGMALVDGRPVADPEMLVDPARVTAARR